MAIEKVLYQTQVTTTGGREGHAVSKDGVLDLNLSTPKELGGKGGMVPTLNNYLRLVIQPAF